MQAIYVVNKKDNVGTAVFGLKKGAAAVTGDAAGGKWSASQDIPKGHKAALRDIAAGELIVKYGVPIGVATRDIMAGEWVHLHNMKSRFDERSSSIDAVSGVMKDTAYE